MSNLRRARVFDDRTLETRHRCSSLEGDVADKPRRPNARWDRLIGFALQLSVVLLSSRANYATAERSNEEPRSLEEEPVNGTTASRFSPEWLEHFGWGEPGCKNAKVMYRFRSAGWGSNLNNLLNTWVYGLTVLKEEDIAVVFESAESVIHGNVLAALQCENESGGAEKVGWRCLFRDMPHLCVFDTTEEWSQFMEVSMSEEERKQGYHFNHSGVRFRNGAGLRAISEALDEEGGVDHIRALAVMASYIDRNRQPWLQNDMAEILGSKELETIRARPFVALHVRRGDKVHKNARGHSEARLIDSEKYLKVAAGLMNKSPEVVSTSEIESVWVSSDDALVKTEIQASISSYFPAVPEKRVSTIPPLKLPDIHPLVDVTGDGFVENGRSFYQTYAAFVNLFVELHMLAEGTVFVGTFSSNVGRLVLLLREAQNQPRDSCKSADRPAWHPGR